MRVLMTGAAGMLGRKLTDRLLTEGRVGDDDVTELELVDVVGPAAGPEGHGAQRHAAEGPGPGGDRSGPSVRWTVGDLGQPDLASAVAARAPDVVFHLAGVVSGEAEADLAKGYRVNLDGTRALFDALAAGPGRPRVVFTSSIAVFGAPFPPVIPDDFHLTPLTSYGAQKAMGEQLLADYSRRGLIDGVGIRLPTITVRPGRPNAAASGFFSSIIREPLVGRPAELPVPESVRHPHASPRSAVANLVHAAVVDGDALGPRRNLTMPSLSVTVGQQLEALAAVGGAEARSLVRSSEDPAVAAIVAGWPLAFAADRARDLGFVCEDDYEAIVRVHLADDPPHAPSHASP